MSVAQDHADLRALLTRPIAFHRLLAVAGGSVGAGVFLSQLIYWDERTTDPEGWVYKTIQDWWNEAALSRFELESIRRALRTRNLIKEKRSGVPAKLYYRIDWDSLQKALPEAIRKHREGTTKLDFIHFQRGESLKMNHLQNGACFFWKCCKDLIRA